MEILFRDVQYNRVFADYVFMALEVLDDNKVQYGYIAFRTQRMKNGKIWEKDREMWIYKLFTQPLGYCFLPSGEKQSISVRTFRVFFIF